jgi:SAM-dependent methyltransferase
MPANPLHEQNRRSWNHATIAHNSHKGDQAAFLRAGGSTLFPEELELLGPLEGRRLVHLQCNAGQDTLSLAARGATVTGVDISDEAIGFATALSAESGVPATFVRSDIYDFLTDSPAAVFDVAFSSYGAIGWLSDLPAWGRGIARILAPGGRFVLVEFHPTLSLFDNGPDGNLALLAPDRVSPTGIYWAQGVHDYVADSADGLLHGATYQPGVQDFRNPEACHEFIHSLGALVDAVARAGLVIERLAEYPYANGWKGLRNMTDLGERRWGLPPGSLPIPLMFALSARKP